MFSIFELRHLIYTIIIIDNEYIHIFMCICIYVYWCNYYTLCKSDWSSHYVMIRFAKVKVCLRGLEVIARFNQLVINYLTIHHSSYTISQALISIYLSHANNNKYLYVYMTIVRQNCILWIIFQRDALSAVSAVAWGIVKN